MTGKIHTPATLPDRNLYPVHACVLVDGHHYATAVGSNDLPFVTCHETRKTWTIEWRELIALAIQCGVATPAEPAAPPAPPAPASAPITLPTAADAA